MTTTNNYNLRQRADFALARLRRYGSRLGVSLGSGSAALFTAAVTGSPVLGLAAALGSAFISGRVLRSLWHYLRGTQHQRPPINVDVTSQYRITGQQAKQLPR